MIRRRIFLSISIVMIVCAMVYGMAKPKPAEIVNPKTMEATPKTVEVKPEMKGIKTEANEIKTESQKTPATALTEEIFPDPCDVIVSIGNKKLTMEEVTWLQPAPTIKEIKGIGEFWLDTQLLYDEAVREGLTDSPKTKFVSGLKARQAVATAMVDKIMDSIEPNESDIVNFYEKNKNTSSRIKEPRYLSFSHIQTKTLEEADAALEKIKKGEDINELAKQLSIASGTNKGGQVKRFRESTVRSRFGNEFCDALLAASEGDLIGPIKISDTDYEIARHEGKRESIIKPLDDTLKEEIKTDLQAQMKKKAFSDYLDSLKKRADKDVRKSRWMTVAEE